MAIKSILIDTNAYTAFKRNQNEAVEIILGGNNDKMSKTDYFLCFLDIDLIWFSNNLNHYLKNLYVE